MGHHLVLVESSPRALELFLGGQVDKAKEAWPE